MNYFELHIGDYQRKTAHLTLAEHGAYSLMLQTFYASERPLPADRKILYRLLRADTHPERKAINSVIAQFWQEDSTGLSNKRASDVLTEYRSWVAKQKANGNRGGRPPKTHGLSDQNPTANPKRSETGDSHLRPPTSHLDHDLDTHSHTPDPESEAAAPQTEGSVCGTFKKIGGEPHANGAAIAPTQTVDEVMAALRAEHRTGGHRAVK